MQQFKDANGNAWGDFRALNKKTNISAKTAAAWVADGIFKAGVHYAQSDDGARKIYYRLDLCADLHKHRLEQHKNNLKAGRYLKVTSKETSSNKKQQVNMMLTSAEFEMLKVLQEEGEFKRYKEVKCGDLVLRSEAEPLSISGIASELLRKTLQQETLRIFGDQHHEKIMAAAND